MPDDWTPAFLATLEATANVTESARLAGVAKSTAYDRQKTDPDFAAAWKSALDSGLDYLEMVGRDRAIKSSDNLLIFLLKAHRPERYRENTAIEATVTSTQAKVMIYLPDNGREPGE